MTVLDFSLYQGDQQKLAFLVENIALSYFIHTLIYTLFGVILVLLVLALHDRLHRGSPDVMRVASIFGLIWAALVVASGMIANAGNATAVELFTEQPDQAVTLWLSVLAIQEALGGGNELVGGLWLLLLSAAALRQGAFHPVLNYLGALAGVAGILTLVPALSVFTSVFGLAQIVWFGWIGTELLREPNPHVLA